MKKIITLICISLTVCALNAQDENEEFKTLFGDKHISHGGYGALDIRYSSIDGKGDSYWNQSYSPDSRSMFPYLSLSVQAG